MVARLKNRFRDVGNHRGDSGEDTLGLAAHAVSHHSAVGGPGCVHAARIQRHAAANLRDHFQQELHIVNVGCPFRAASIVPVKSSPFTGWLGGIRIGNVEAALISVRIEPQKALHFLTCPAPAMQDDEQGEWLTFSHGRWNMQDERAVQTVYFQ